MSNVTLKDYNINRIENNKQFALISFDTRIFLIQRSIVEKLWKKSMKIDLLKKYSKITCPAEWLPHSTCLIIGATCASTAGIIPFYSATKLSFHSAGYEYFILYDSLTGFCSTCLVLNVSLHLAGLFYLSDCSCRILLN